MPCTTVQTAQRSIICSITPFHLLLHNKNGFHLLPPPILPRSPPPRPAIPPPLSMASKILAEAGRKRPSPRHCRGPPLPICLFPPGRIQPPPSARGLGRPVSQVSYPVAVAHSTSMCLLNVKLLSLERNTGISVPVMKFFLNEGFPCLQDTSGSGHRQK